MCAFVARIQGYQITIIYCNPFTKVFLVHILTKTLLLRSLIDIARPRRLSWRHEGAFFSLEMLESRLICLNLLNNDNKIMVLLGNDYKNTAPLGVSLISKTTSECEQSSRMFDVRAN